MVSIRFAFDMLISQYKKSILMIMLLVVSLLLVMFSIMVYEGENYAKTSCDGVLKAGIKGTGRISLDEESFYKVNEALLFLKEAKKRSEISAIGTIVDYGVVDPSGGILLELQGKNVTDYQNALEDYLEVKTLLPSIVDLCDFQLKEGIPIEALDFSDKKVEYWYLGSAYEEIPIGTEYEGEYGYRYIVAGILKEGMRWIDSNLINGYDTTQLDYSQDCAHSIFAFSTDDINTSEVWITAAEGFSIEQAIMAACEVGEKYKIHFGYETLADMYRSEVENVNILIKILSKIMVIIISSACFMLVITQVVVMLEDSKNYGIMYAVGFSEKEVKHMLITKYIITSVLALVIAIPSCIWIADKWFTVPSLQYMIRTILLQNVIPSAIIFIVVVILLLYIVTGLFLKKMTPNTLIRCRL